MTEREGNKDTQLVDRFVARDRDAEEQMMARCHPIARKLAVAVFVRRRVSRHSRRLEPMDLYGEAVATVLEDRARIFATYDHARPLDPFLYRVLRNHMLDVVSAELRRTTAPIEEAAEPAVAPPDVDRELDTNAALRRARASLSPLGQRVMDLMLGAHKSDDEIAGLCAMTKANVQLWRWRLGRALEAAATELALRAPGP